jgi:hypothetical protein
MHRMIFNATKPTITPLDFLPEVGDDWPVDDWKYADMEFVYPRTTDLVRYVVDAAPLTGRFKRILIDVKVQDLTPDITSCIPGWHIDGAFPEDGVADDTHHLFVMNGPLTEFIDEPVEMHSLSRESIKLNFALLAAGIRKDVKVATCAPNAITTFTSRDFHRGVVAREPTRRLLIRLTETNTVLTNNRPKAPSHGARIAA